MASVAAHGILEFSEVCRIRMEGQKTSTGTRAYATPAWLALASFNLTRTPAWLTGTLRTPSPYNHFQSFRVKAQGEPRTRPRIRSDTPAVPSRTIAMISGRASAVAIPAATRVSQAIRVTAQSSACTFHIRQTMTRRHRGG